MELVRCLKEKECIDDSTIKVINHFSHNGEMTYEQLEPFASEHGMIASYNGMWVEF